MGKLELYIPVGRERLRCGYTTGTCAAAAAAGAAALLLEGVALPAVHIDTPAGVRVEAELLKHAAGEGWAACAVRKDGGDDPDVTDGALICARVERSTGPGIAIDGGEGVGRVTRPGLDQPVGEAAINSVPRRMIARAAEEEAAALGYAGGLEITISVPGGEEAARRTFNPQLGVEGGISILGTSGIVEPMSEAALLATIRLDIRQQAAGGPGTLVLTPGNYGETFVRERLGLDLDRAVKCSNYIGASIDMAVEEGIREVLLVGHAGKLVKVAAGIMNTHSSVADGRMEILAAHGAACGAGPELVEQILESITVDQALEYMEQVPGLGQAVMDRVIRRMDGCLRRRAGKAMKIEAVVFTNARGLLGRTKGADGLIEKIKAGG